MTPPPPSPAQPRGAAAPDTPADVPAATRPGPTGSSPVEAVDRALLVLQALAPAGPRGLALAELAGTLGLSKATVHRVLAALRFRGFVVQDARGAYVLGPAATRLADDFLGEENLPVLLHPALVALSAAADELVHLGVLDGSHVVYLDKVEPARALRVWSAVGRRVPAVTTALGRALLAWRGTGRQALEGYVQAVAGEQAADAARAWDAVERAREQGWATEVEENEAGISCVAVPLLRSGAAVAAVSVTAPAERMTPDRVDALRRTVAEVLPPLLPAGLALPEGVDR
ncbi:IclR family transcriptional regulator [Cellulomonas marina]|uniref:Glycerol operon regulatory protein n=1 Tax=Cellulomonas marina TaxID=988821 RepID=A0A1I0Y2C3_9CELL|nr:IclR family transcriptional regulator [Cellulomonas marina]GIG28436.1 transcriptional regulator [Cellulomonas marina]SFB06353.1 DNA-binding transcriptional regulator, IclR family [Cellulomonas marina]